MNVPQFTAIIRLPFVRGSFVDPPQAQWDAEKDRQLWKVISKSSKTSDLNWVELATKFRVPPTFLLQQAAWLYERHLQHVRNQMKKVSIPATVAGSSTSGSNLNTVSGIAMRRTASGDSEAARTTSALSVRPWDSPNVRGETSSAAPLLSRTPSTTTITQSRAYTKQAPARIQSTLSAQRSNSRRSDDQTTPLTSVPPPERRGSADSSGLLDSSSSDSSSLSDTNHPAHRSQLFKRPPRFRQQRPQDLATFDEGDGTQEAENSGSHGHSHLPFASTARRQTGKETYTQDMPFRNNARSGRKFYEVDGPSDVTPLRRLSQDQQSQATTETASSITSFADDASKGAAMSPRSPTSNHRAELARLGSPRATGLRKEGSEGTPSMGSSFSDIDDAGISQSALEEALLSNMQHGKMSTLSRMSRYL